MNLKFLKNTQKGNLTIKPQIPHFVNDPQAIFSKFYRFLKKITQRAKTF